MKRWNIPHFFSWGANEILGHDKKRKPGNYMFTMFGESVVLNTQLTSTVV